MSPIRWGILGTGNIARVFRAGLSFVPDAEVVAVGSRREKSAEEFGRRFDIPHRHASNEDLAHDPEVDVVYIATPHVFHRDQVYPVSLASMLFGTSTDVTGLAHLGETGVEEQSAMVLKYSEGQLAVLASAMRTGTQREALIYGTRGYIKVHAPFHGSSSLTIVKNRNLEDTTSRSFENSLFQRLKDRAQAYGKHRQLLQALHAR